MPRELFDTLVAKGAKMSVSKFEIPRKYGLAASTSGAGDEIFVECDTLAILTTSLHIRHGSTLTIRNVSWYVAKQQVPEALLGRPILEALGLNTKELLAAACDRFNGVADAEQLLTPESHAQGTVARLI
jgi:hypothetical protein